MIHPRDWYVEIAGQGPDLVLLHGLGASSFSWRHNRAPLSRHFRVITPDLPGHGRSPAPVDADYRAEALVRGVVDFLDWQGLDTVALGGNSLGGGLSLVLAREHPARVSALVLLAPAAALTRIPYAFWPLRLPVLGYAVAALLGPWLLPWFMRLVYCHPERLIPEAVAGYAPPYRDLSRRLALRQVCRQLEIRPLGRDRRPAPGPHPAHDPHLGRTRPHPAPRPGALDGRAPAPGGISPPPRGWPCPPGGSAGAGEQDYH